VIVVGAVLLLPREKPPPAGEPGIRPQGTSSHEADGVLPRAPGPQIEPYLRAVVDDLGALVPPPEPEAQDLEAEAADRDALERERAQVRAAVAAFEKEIVKNRKNVLDALLDALTLEKIQDGKNLHDAVNVQAAALIPQAAWTLDEKGRARLTRDLVRAVETLQKRRDPTVRPDVLAAALEALARAGDLSGLEWMADNYLHTRDNEKDGLVAAHRAMILYENVPGKMRYRICDVIIKVYLAVEAQADQDAADAAGNARFRRLWSVIGPGVIACLQHFAGRPADADGAPLDRMEEFHAWWRGVRNPAKPPWLDAR